MTGGRRARPGGRRPAGDPIVVGRRPVLEAIRSGLAREVLVAEAAREGSSLSDVLAGASEDGIPVRVVPAAVIERLASGARHQGVAALGGAPPPLGEGDLSRRAWPERAVVLVLDGVTDPQNVGAAARSAEGAGAAGMVLRRRRGARITPAAVKASAGALLRLPVAAVANLPRALDRLKEAGFWVVGLDANARQALALGRRPEGRLALVVGSEGAGLSRLVRDRCDELVAIPLRGEVESLNVSVAAGIALFSYVLLEERGPGRGDPGGTRHSGTK